jgi:aldose 1-epimerase
MQSTDSTGDSTGDSTCLSAFRRDHPAATAESKDIGMLTLQAGEASLTLAPETGGAIVGWTVGAHHVLRPPLPDSLLRGSARGMAAFPLVPYSNRIGNARFAFAGRSYQLARNFGDEPHSIHGVGWTSVWDVAEIGAHTARLTLAYDARGEAGRGWPFPFDAEMRFALDPDKLAVTLAMTNRHDEPAPAGLGLHPFFPRADAATLRFAAGGVWRNGTDHLPEKHVPVPPEWTHDPARRVGSATLDNLFTGWNGTAEITLSPSPIIVRLSASEVFRRLVVYVPEGKPYFAVEPVSHRTDAINHPDEDTGLRILAPGETLEGEIRFRLG